MERLFSRTARSLVALATLAWANLVLGQPGPTLTVVETSASINVQTAAEQAAEKRIYAILETRFTEETRNTTLSELLARIRRSTGLPIHLDVKSLEEASIGVDSPVNCELPPVSLRSALDLVLGPWDLTWAIQDECVLVTTRDKASNLLINKVYPVQDLVGTFGATNRGANNYQPLMQTITDTIASATWDEVGGPGAIVPFDPAGSIIVSQTREVHEELEQLLAALRRARGIHYVARGGGHARRHGSRHPYRSEQFESAEPARYAVTPTAVWSLPQVHE